MPSQSWTLTATGQWVAPGTAPVSARDLLVAGTYRPDAGTTGVLPGISRTTWSGNLTTSASGQVIENLDITGRLIINHGGVVVRNCTIAGGTPPSYATDNSYGSVKAFNAVSPKTTFYDCTIYSSVASVDASAGIQGRDFDLYRCNIYGVVDGARTQYGNVGIYQCWIHDLPWYSVDPRQTSGGSHNDGIQCEGGGNNYVIRGNSIEMGGSTNAALMITQNVGNITGLIIDKNWLYSVVGGSWTGINLSEKGLGAATGVQITNNRFSDLGTWRHNKHALIDSNTYDVATISGNVNDSDGAAATISRVAV
jgi:hypothetical protein